MDIRESILFEAHNLVHGVRGEDYGHPYEDFSRTAKIWSAILGKENWTSRVCLIQGGDPPYPAAATVVHKREVSACVALEEIVRLVKEEKFYKSSVWEKKRLEILERDNYECQVCKEEGGFAPATTVHHILHLENRPDLALDDDNLLSVCAACHNREHPERFIHRIVQRKRNELAERFPERW